MNKPKLKTKKRGVFLTLVIVYLIVNILESIVNIRNFNQYYILLFNPIPWWIFPLLIVGDLTEVIGVIGIIKWKKWGVYSIFLSLFSSLLLSFFVIHPLIIFISVLVLSLLVFWAIFRKWASFT